MRRREEQETMIYAMNLMLLQKELGMTYKEARAFMIDRLETQWEMAADLGIEIHSIYNLQRKAKKKLEKSGKSYEEIVGKFAMEEKLILDGPPEKLPYVPPITE